MHGYSWALKPERERKRVSTGGLVTNTDNCFCCSPYGADGRGDGVESW